MIFFPTYKSPISFIHLQRRESLPFEIDVRNGVVPFIRPSANVPIRDVFTGEILFVEIMIEEAARVNSLAKRELFISQDHPIKYRVAYERTAYVMRGVLNWAAGSMHQFQPAELPLVRPILAYFQGDEPQVRELRERYQQIFYQDGCIGFRIFIAVTDGIRWKNNTDVVYVRRILQECLRSDNSGFKLPEDWTVLPDVFTFHSLDETSHQQVNVAPNFYRIANMALWTMLMESYQLECFVWFQIMRDPNAPTTEVH